MDPKLAHYLWKSAEVRTALKKEALRLLALIGLALVFAMGIRYFTDRPLTDRLDSLLVSLGVAVLVWVISVVRTVRRVLRENALF